MYLLKLVSNKSFFFICGINLGLEFFNLLHLNFRKHENIQEVLCFWWIDSTECRFPTASQDDDKTIFECS